MQKLQLSREAPAAKIEVRIVFSKTLILVLFSKIYVPNVARCMHLQKLAKMPIRFNVKLEAR